MPALTCDRAWCSRQWRWPTPSGGQFQVSKEPISWCRDIQRHPMSTRYRCSPLRPRLPRGPPRPARRRAPKAKTGAKPAAKTAPTSRNETASKLAKSAAKPRKPEARDGSKKGAVIELLRRKEGVTAAEIAAHRLATAHDPRLHLHDLQGDEAGHRVRAQRAGPAGLQGEVEPASRSHLRRRRLCGGFFTACL